MRKITKYLLAVTLGIGCGYVARLFMPKPKAEVIYRESPVASASASTSEQKAGMPVGGRPEAEPPYPTGYVLWGRQINIMMSDGTVRAEVDAELTEVRRNGITLNGEKLFFKAAPRPQNPVSSVSSVVSSFPASPQNGVSLGAASSAPPPVDNPKYPPAAYELRSTYSTHRWD